MSISFQCPGCAKQFTLKEELANRRIQCRCGQVMRVPSPPPPAAADDPFGLPELGESDPLASLMEGEAVPAAPKLPPLPSKPAATVPGPAKPKVSMDWGVLAKLVVAPLVILAMVIVSGYLLMGVVTCFKPGYATPEEALTRYQKAMAFQDWPGEFAALDPSSQEIVADQLALMAAWMSKPIPELRPVLSKHHISIPASLTATFGDAALGEDDSDKPRRVSFVEPPAHLAASVLNKKAFYVDLMEAMAAHDEQTGPTNPMLKYQAQQAKMDVKRAMAKGKLSDLQIDGDQAHGIVTYSLGKRTIKAPLQFQRVSGRWLLHLDGDEESFINLQPSVEIRGF